MKINQLMKITAFIICLTISALASNAQTTNVSVTQTSDKRLARIVNAAYYAGDTSQEITFAQKVVDHLRTINTDVPAFGKTNDGTYRRGPFITEATIHTFIDKAAYKAAKDESIVRMGAMHLDMPKKGIMEVVGCTDRSRLGERSSKDILSVYETFKKQSSVTGDTYRILYPMYAFDGTKLGVIEFKFRNESTVNRMEDAASYYVHTISQRAGIYADLVSPYDEGFRPSDMLCQKISQIILARHPELSIFSIHIVDPADPKKQNRHYALNRPNFHKESGALTLDSEVTGKIFAVMLPYSHMVEMHLPLIDKSGAFVGVIVCDYPYNTINEGANYFGRSTGLMEETMQLMPDNFSDLFKP